ncbi:MAG TPA: PilN domain-containing protein [Candidatus Paceibacterota bacterium]|nr:PilN domain-containing protein [Candidatus Paceibacterota bacterium]
MVESKFQTSFIPKKPIDTGPRNSSRGGPSLLRLIAILILLISLVAWGGVFLYKVYLNNKIQNDTESLQNSQKEFDLKTVTTLTRLSDRLTNAQNLLNNHIATSKIFDELEANTLKNVRFTDFNLSASNANAGELTLTLKGQATAYADVASQSDVFDQNPDFKNPIFSNLDLDGSGRVVFSVTTNLDRKSFLYTNGANLGTESSAPAAAANTNSPFNQ